MILFADCGNTAVKLAWPGGRIRLAAEAVADWCARERPDACVLLPGAAATAAMVRTACTGIPIREAGRELPLPDLGQYPGFGPDRLCAGLAAPAPCIVIDAGTATTLTAWADGRRFAGGLILPGPHALIAGLVARAPALPLCTPLPADAPAAQRDTRGAIAAAAGIGHPAMVSACLERLSRETGITRVLVTGGGAEALLTAGLIATHAPWLVLDGLRHLADRLDAGHPAA